MKKDHDLIIDEMIKEGIIVLPDDPLAWYPTKQGENKLSAVNLTMPADLRKRIAFLRNAIDTGIIDQSDVHMKFLALSEITGFRSLSRDVAHLYAEMIKNSGVNFDRLCSLPYSGITTGELTADILGVPHAFFRKAQEARQKPTVGPVNSGDTLAFLDDILYQGDAIKRYAKLIRLYKGDDIIRCEGRERTSKNDTIFRDAKMLCNFNGCINTRDADKQKSEGSINVHDAFVFLDCSAEGGGRDKCREIGIDTHGIMDTERLKHIIIKNPNISQEVKDLF